MRKKSIKKLSKKQDSEFGLYLTRFLLYREHGISAIKHLSIYQLERLVECVNRIEMSLSFMDIPIDANLELAKLDIQNYIDVLDSLKRI